MFVKNTNLNYKTAHFQEFKEISVISEKYQNCAQENIDPEVYLQCTHRLFKLFGEIEAEYVSSPQEFLFVVFQSSCFETEKNPSVMKTCIKLLQQQYLASMPYQELESLINVEQFQKVIIQQIFASEQDIRSCLVDLYSQVITQFWLENSCFERKMKQIVKHEGTSDILTSFMDKLDLILQIQMQNEDGGEIVLSESKITIENQNIYKTLQMVKNTVLLDVFQVMHQLFQKEQSTSSEVVVGLSQCLRMFSLSFEPGKNQMGLKIAAPQNESLVVELQGFCSPESVLQIAQRLLNENTLNKSEIFELMVQILSCEYFSDAFCVLDAIIEIIDQQVIPNDQLCKIFLCVNSKMQFDQKLDSLKSWFTKLSEYTEQAVDNFEQLSVATFTRILRSWIPVLTAFQASTSLEQAQQYEPIVVEFLAPKVCTNFLMLSSKNCDQSFRDEDTFAEQVESSNMKSINEILQAPMMLAAMGGNCLQACELIIQSIITLCQEISIESAETQCPQLCWLLHSLRVLYKECVCRLEVEGVKMFLPIVEQRLQCVNKITVFFLQMEELGLNQAIDTVSSSDISEKQSLVFQVKYASTKCMRTVAKSLLSQKIKQRIQEKIADDVASLAGYTSRDQVLTNLIKFCLVQIEVLKASQKESNSNWIPMLFEQTLKILVYLTVTKPYINKETKSMSIKGYFTLDFATLLQLKDYLKQQISQNKGQKSIDFKHQRLVVVSLTTLMCEFDTLSDSAEVLDDVYSAIDENFMEITQARQQGTISPSQFIYLFRGILNNLRALFEGVYRSKQYMWLLNEKFMRNENALIKDFILEVLCNKAVLMEDDQSVPQEDKISLSKSILKLFREITQDRDSRIQLDSRICSPIVLMHVTIKATFSCLGTLKSIDLQNGGEIAKEAAMSILKKAIRVSLQIGSGQQMATKHLEQHPELKEAFSCQLSSLLEGLKVLLLPSAINILDQKSQKLLFEFVYFMMQRQFGLILFLSRQEGNASYFSYTLSLVSEGLRSTQSTALLISLDCIDSMHNYSIKGSKYYRQAIKELLSLPETIEVFKKIVKLNLRSFLRHEQTNKSRKIECTVKIINMYRIHIDSELPAGSLSFYEKCAMELASEYQESQQDPNSLNEVTQNGQITMSANNPVYAHLIQMVANLNWQGAKPAQIAVMFRQNLEASI